MRRTDKAKSHNAMYATRAESSNIRLHLLVQTVYFAVTLFVGTFVAFIHRSIKYLRCC